jgi:hypothetical protein
MGKCIKFLWIVHSISLTFIKSLCLLSSNVWFSGVPHKDKDYTVAMYVYFIKVHKTQDEDKQNTTQLLTLDVK